MDGGVGVWGWLCVTERHFYFSPWGGGVGGGGVGELVAL